MTYGSPVDYTYSSSEEYIKQIKDINIVKLDKDYPNAYISLNDVYNILPGGPTICNKILMMWRVPIRRVASHEVYEYKAEYYIAKLDLISLINHFKISSNVKLYKCYN